MNGIEHLREARRVLNTETGDARERLRLAARRFWAATFEAPAWPLLMREKADTIQRALLRAGTIDRTVPQMTEEAARRVSESLVRFCEEAERRVEAGEN